MKEPRIHQFTRLAITLLLLCPPVSTGAAPAGLVDRQIISGGSLNLPTALAYEPGNRNLWVLEKAGGIKVFDGQTHALLHSFSISGVQSDVEMGLLGIAFSPNYASDRHVFFYVTRSNRNHVLRYTVSTGGALTAETEIYTGPGLVAGHHQGGTLRFALDGTLLISMGDNGTAETSRLARDLNDPRGSILRINPDGSIPADNPFTSAGAPEIWIWGARNPFRFSVDPATGKALVADVGEDYWEAIYNAEGGADLGWPCLEGSHNYQSCSAPNALDPIFEYHHYGQTAVRGRAITGGPMYRSNAFPPQYRNRYYFGDYGGGWIKSGVLSGNQLTDIQDFENNAPGVVDIIVSPTGCLTWVSIVGAGVHEVCNPNAPTNTQPQAVASATPTSGDPPLTVQFTGSGSSDPDGDTLAYFWQFGDGATSTAANPTHVYTSEGTYQATLTVNDQQGQGNSTDSSTPIQIVVGTPVGPKANDNFEDEHYSGSGRCTLCHDGLTDDQGQDISIVKSWSTSMMANASRDPYWRAKVASELKRNPALSEEINDKCSRCHAPMANDVAHKEGLPIEIFGSGMLNSNHALFNHALDGVSCTLCHQIADDGNLGTPAGGSGAFYVQQYADSRLRPAYGQYDNPLAGPMRNMVSFTPELGAHTSTSELCAACHDLKTPFVDAAGNIVPATQAEQFPEQMAYSEWEHSDYRDGGAQQKTCQACHMPQASGDVKIANRPGSLQARPGFSQHSFLGANTTMMAILADHPDELQVSATGFEPAIAATRDFLQAAASLEIVSKKLVGNQLEVVLKVSNHSGHKFPTGYPSRRAWLHVTVRDAQGDTVFESGRANADGSIVGADNDQDWHNYEPHYSLIDSPDQVQIYEPIMQNTDGEVTHTLLRAAAYIKDNRLTPAGFDKNTASSDIAVVGAAAEDDDFNLGSDTITYRIDVGGAQGLTVEAELNYQSLSYGHLQNLFTDAGSTAQVDAFKTHFESARIRSETIARVTATVATGCDVTLDISPNQWNQIGIPCAPPANANTLNDVFGDDLTGVYGADWAAYRYDAVNQRYVYLQPDSIVAPGVGYWIIETRTESTSIDLPEGSALAPVAQSSQCLSDNGCA
ncbi:MAG TPA: PKD domain-containing protein, partial [Gammaproteobacteria bacterium]|nr:PKD domain-containing protein [Gammaproteobacteria bacterium]